MKSPNLNYAPWIAQAAPTPSNRQTWRVADAEKNSLFHGSQEMCKAIAALPDLLAALEFYANPQNWKEQETGIGMAPSEAEDDHGSSAQAALTKAGYTF